MKKILYCLTFALAFIMFSSDAKALQCLYESHDGDQMAVSQFYSIGSGWSAYAYTIGDIKIRGEIIKDDTFTYKVYNDTVRIDEWKEIDHCPKLLKYNVSVGQDEVYLCDKRSDCGDGDLTFNLKDVYTQTPNNVGLNKMMCTYASQNTEGYINTYSFVIDVHNGSTMSGSYSLWKNYNKLYDSDFSKDGINKNVMNATFSTSESYFDSFTIRTFWNEEKDYFQCPGEIAVTSECEINALIGSSDCAYYIGYEDNSNSELISSGGFLWSQISSKKFDVYKLAQNASYIDYDSSVTDDTICVFTYENLVCNPKEESCDPEIKLNLMERKYADGRTDFLSVINTNYTSFEEKSVTTLLNIDEITSCNTIKEIYTDCLTTTNSSCKVSTNRSDIEYDAAGHKLNTTAEKLVPNVWSNTQDVTDVTEGMSSFNGLKYKKLMCELSGRLTTFTDRTVLSTLPKLDFYGSSNTKETLAINNLNCSDWGYSSDYICNTEECKEQLSYSLELKLKETKDYCNDVFKKYIKNLDNTTYNDRKEECLSFNDFYQNLVSKGIVADQTQGCEFISIDLGYKLVWILDLLKIAAPILAIGLGTLDFVKAVASGDSDKEMKTAFKRFSTRIIAAILLFLVPFILSFLMDIFLENQEGYDSDNPFCNLVDWEE